MAVTKIRKISSWTLLIASVITIAVLGIFFFGGVLDPTAENKEPVFTNLLLSWTYILFGITAIATVIFAIWQVVNMFSIDPKGAMIGIGAIVAFAIVMVIAYAIGDATPLVGLNADSEKYNTSFWLKLTDTWLYSTYILIGLIILGVIAGSVKRILDR